MLFLAFNFLSVNGMSEGDTTQESEPSIEDLVQAEQTCLSKQSLSLKTKCALKVLDLMRSNKLSWDDLSYLPEGLARYVALFHTVNVYFDDSNITNDKELAELIPATKELFYKLISSESEHVEKFIAALDDFFDPAWLVDDVDVASYRNEPYRRINLFLKIILDRKNAKKEIANFVEKYGKNCLAEDLSADNVLRGFIYVALRDNLIFVIDFILSLNLLERKEILNLFWFSCNESHDTVTILQLLNDSINITKEEFEALLTMV